MGRIGKLLLSLAVGGAFLVLAFRNVDHDQLRDAFAHLDARWLVPAVCLSLLLQVFRAWRWQLELRPLAHVPFGTLWVVVSVAYMAINLLPIRMGEVVRPWLLSRRSTVSFSNVVGNLIVEKTVDSAVIVFYILLGLLTTENLPAGCGAAPWCPPSRSSRSHSSSCSSGGGRARSSSGGLARWLPERFRARVVGVARALVDGMRVLGHPALVVAVFAVSIVLWSFPSSRAG